MVGIELFDFQKKAVNFLIEKTSIKESKKIITLKAPTGGGKTIILVDFIDQYLNLVDKKTTFIWLSPGKGDLEEQSLQKMGKLLPQRASQNLHDALINGFDDEVTTFINWELVTKKGNNAIKDGERKNLYDHIKNAHMNGTEFIVIIDEEHSHNTSKANAIIDAFAAKHIIRVSATTIANKLHEYYEIDEVEVINSGLITKALYVNDSIENNITVDNDYEYLLDLADEKRKAIAKRYTELNKKIRPLVLIQFPNAEPRTILSVEEKLSNMGYTYENGMVAKWLSGDKSDIPENLTDNDAIPVFLLMKQAISTGWDCPRAKILVKLRENMNETFEIQTIGRIRRMPESKHYDDDELDHCYVYTFDEKYKAGLLQEIDKAYEIRRLFLKDKCKFFSLPKETRDLDFDMLAEREVFNKVYNHMVQKYKIGNNKEQTRKILTESDYKFGCEVIEKVLHGEFVKTSSLADSEQYYIIRKTINTHMHGIDLQHAVDEIKSAIGMKSSKLKRVLERLFRKSKGTNNKLLSLETKEFYAFIINNRKLLKKEFLEVTSELTKQQTLVLAPKIEQFKIAEQDFYKYDPLVKDEVDILSNAYEKYTTGYMTNKLRSNSEQLFEYYCNNNEDIDWIYKNGDSGRQYLSVVYIDALQKQWLFYPDYILCKNDGSIWIIETKGGEYKGKDKNIDKQIQNKFYAFKRYAEENELNWGFVRDMDNKLFFNNTEYTISMQHENWEKIEKFI